MKGQEEGNSKQGNTGRLRFPFMPQKQSISQPPPPRNPSPTHGFFNLRKFGSKPPPTIISTRKAVSFSPGTTNEVKKSEPDHTDVTYRDAVSKLRNILIPKPADFQENFTNLNLALPPSSPPADVKANSFLKNIGMYPGKIGAGGSIFKGGDWANKLNLTPLSLEGTNQRPYPLSGSAISTLQNIARSTSNFPAANNHDLLDFIDKQEQYIQQLEKETSVCRQELSSVLDKVKDIISENEELHEKQKREILTAMINELGERPGTTSGKFEMNGKSEQLIRGSRIAELEAQLVQCKRSLRLAQEEVLELKRGFQFQTIGDAKFPAGESKCGNCEAHLAQIDSLSREKTDLNETISKCKEKLNDVRERENEALRKVKTSLQMVDKMKDEKAQADLEFRRLKEDLERSQERIRDLIQEHSRKMNQEKLQVEKKYQQEIDRLNNEMSQDYETLTKAKLDLERQKRIEAELRRELSLKANVLEDFRAEMQTKINHLQAELSHTFTLKSSTEQDLINSRLQGEKVERDGKQESCRLQTELNLVRKRLEQTDDDFRRSQDQIVHLNETISELQRDASLARIRLEGHLNLNPEEVGDVSSIIHAMEDKQLKDMTELEQLIQVQNNLLDKLRNECKLLAEKLDETTQQNKKEKTILETENEKLKHLHHMASQSCANLEHKVNFYASSHEEMTSRLHKLEDDDKARSEKIFGLLSKQSGILKENQNLQSEVAYLRQRLGEDLRHGNNRSVT